jgi:integrase/recombinase XerD
MQSSLILSSSQSISLPTPSIDIIEEFLKSQDVKPNSRDLYRRTLRQFIRWLEDSNLSIMQIKREEILQYKEWLLNSERSHLTVGSYLTSVRKLFEWLETKHYYPNIAKGIKTPRREKGFKKDVLTTDQIKELLISIDPTDLKGKRDFAILNLLLRTGLRTIELVRANVEDISQKGNEVILYVHGKGHDSKDRFVLLTSKAYLPIREYLNVREHIQSKQPLFVSLSRNNPNGRMTTRAISGLAKEGLRNIGINSPKLTAHSFRHTAAVNVLKSGADLYTTQLFMRHSDPATTQIYLKTIEEEMRLKNAPEKLLDNVF